MPSWIITVSDTRTPETDTGGALLAELLERGGHPVVGREIVRDEPAAIRGGARRRARARRACAAVLLTGGTGVAPRDVTPEAIEPRLERVIPGFGELFRALSYQRDRVGGAALARAGRDRRGPRRARAAGLARGDRGSRWRSSCCRSSGTSPPRRSRRAEPRRVTSRRSAATPTDVSARIAVSLLLPLLLALAGAAENFVWVDEAGVTHITNDPERVPEPVRERAHDRRVAALALGRAAGPRRAAGERRARPRRGAHAPPAARRRGRPPARRERARGGAAARPAARAAGPARAALVSRAARPPPRALRLGRATPPGVPRHRGRRARALAQLRARAARGARRRAAARRAHAQRCARRLACAREPVLPRRARPRPRPRGPRLREHRCSAIWKRRAASVAERLGAAARRADGRGVLRPRAPTTRRTAIASRSARSASSTAASTWSRPRTRRASCARCCSTSTPTRCSASGPAATRPTG